MRKLLPLLLLFAGSAFGQQLVNCTGTAPCTPTGPSVTRTGDAAYVAFGKLNADLLELPSELFSQQLSVIHGGTGATTLAGASIPIFTGAITSGNCVQWVSATSIGDSGATCGSGGSSSAFSSITSSTNTTAALVVGSGATLAPSGTGTIKANLLATGFVASIANGGTGAATLAGANIPVQTGAITSGHCVQWASATSITDGGTCGTGFIAGSLTSTQVIATYAPAANAGASVLTSDMGMMACDGTRWNVVGTPPVPPGALVLSYHHNVFTYFPVIADIGMGHTTSIGAFRIYSGYLGINTSEPAISGAFQTASNGQLQLNYTGVTNGSGVFTIVPFYTAPLSQDYGQAGLALGSKGFYAEIAYTDSSNNGDVWDAMYVEPQEHNPLKIYEMPGSPYPANYEAWHEFDVNESGHGTDQAGAYRGNWIQWAGGSTGTPVAVTLAGAGANAGDPTITLLNPWTGDTSFTSHKWTIKFNTGETRTAVMTNGSTGPFTLSSPLSSTETAAASITTYASLTSGGFTDTASLDYTVEHIFGASYDPVGKIYSLWQDGVFLGSISTANVNSNTFRDALHYMIVVQANSRGAHVVHSMTVRYIALWTP